MKILKFSIADSDKLGFLDVNRLIQLFSNLFN